MSSLLGLSSPALRDMSDKTEEQIRLQVNGEMKLRCDETKWQTKRGREATTDSMLRGQGFTV